MKKAEFLDSINRIGVEKGMNLMVHSSLRRIGLNVKNGAEMVIESLLDSIGPEGTLLVPTVTGNVTPDQPVFHVQHTPSTVGHLTNVLRKYPNALRSLHPVHSVAAIGPHAEFFTAGHHTTNTPWSPETPYGRMLRDDNCSILFLGVSLDFNTCFHALEIEAQLPGMHTAESTVLYGIEESGRTYKVNHHWHDLRTRRHFQDMELLLQEGGCLRWGRTGSGLSRLVRAVPMCKMILNVLAQEPWLMTCPSADNDFIWKP